MNNNIPLYKKRRWVLFKQFLNIPDVRKSIKEYFNNPKRGKIAKISVFAKILEARAPYGCEQAYARSLEEPKATEEELISLIESPVKVFSHKTMSIEPSNRPYEEYSELTRVSKSRISDGKKEDYFEHDASVYLKVDPFTSKTEIIDFINANFETLIQPKLNYKKQYQNDSTLPVQYLYPKKRAREIGVVKRILPMLQELRDKGMPYKEISEKIYEEIGVDIEESNLRSIYSSHKKSQQ